ncbi:MAG TPA: BamA/TamA family outer membrane protein [Bacteroidales bacterium]|nr:BamA/TamA family outer membrane protein [Bacteroidales bacterium]
MFALLALFILFFASCSPVKYVPEDKYLLDRYKVKIDKGTAEKEKLKKEELKSLVRQKPNKRILGVRFHLGLYNLSRKEKEKGLSGWLKRIGEEPVIYDDFLTNKSAQQIKSYLNNKGYYNSVVSDTAIFKRQRARVLYRVKVNKPYKIRQLSYNVQDSLIEPLILKDSVNSLIATGENFDLDLLQEERERIETYLKNQGYYNFSKEFIFFQADSSSTNREVSLILNLKKFQQINENRSTYDLNHKKYKINKVYVFTNYSQKEALAQKEKYYSDLDTTYVDGIYFISKGVDPLKKKIFLHANFIQEGDVYSLYNVEKTYQHLNALRLFRLINIKFNEVEADSLVFTDSIPLDYLNCNILLTKHYLQSYTVELEGTNSYGNIGVGGNLLYQHKSLFGGAEITDFKINGSIEALDTSVVGISRINNAVELGADITMRIPKFMLPVFKARKFSKKYSPKTQISVGYNFQDRLEYRRTVANLSYGYNWDGNNFLRHNVKLVELNAVKIPYASETFRNFIDSTYLRSSYENHLVSVSSYSLVFNNQDIKKNRDFYFFRMNTEISGNILSAYSELTNAAKVNGSYEIFGIPFSQYIKIDADFRYYDIKNQSSSFAYRLFAGVGIPYGNSQSLPFEKMYFSGGANSLRAWNVRSLGPGSFSGKVYTRFPNQTGDIKLEANAEFRFKLFWILEGALFLEAGNIWNLKSDEFEGGLFKKDEFYKEFAVGTGFGTRVNLSFFVFRLDLGVKLRDPSLQEESRWIIGNRSLNWQNDFTLNIGIGYPF